MWLFSTHTTTNTHTETVVPYEKTVHEYRAPTDESIKLYKEMEEKIYSSIIEKTYIDNIIKASILKVELWWDFEPEKYVISLSINWEEYMFEMDYDKMQLANMNFDNWYYNCEWLGKFLFDRIMSVVVSWMLEKYIEHKKVFWEID